MEASDTDPYAEPVRFVLGGKKLMPTETRFYNLLCDGMRHGKHELHELVNDELSGLNNISTWVSLLRKKLPPNRMIICEFYKGRYYYRMVEKIYSSNE